MMDPDVQKKMGPSLLKKQTSVFDKYSEPTPTAFFKNNSSNSEKLLDDFLLKPEALFQPEKQLMPVLEIPELSKENSLVESNMGENGKS